MCSAPVSTSAYSTLPPQKKEKRKKEQPRSSARVRYMQHIFNHLSPKRVAQLHVTLTLFKINKHQK